MHAQTCDYGGVNTIITPFLVSFLNVSNPVKPNALAVASVRFLSQSLAVILKLELSHIFDIMG